ncbi:uncharacterized protein LOC126782844 [Argentina anserina]|uniref:uncharacterized protein LOC126782844 n=1 Tax=Argentina anserina TaxID=57926 RepID=UPI0021762827|nr:uncharacterized protein LOC126782844 [Potentilla anserina]
MGLLQRVFASELKCYPLLLSKLESYRIIYPEINPTQSNEFDSGIFTVRNMQHYGDYWHDGFNSGDQRIKLALEIVNNPYNECLADVMDGVNYWKNVVGSTQVGRPSRGNTARDDDADISFIPCCIKFKPRIPRRS